MANNNIIFNFLLLMSFFLANNITAMQISNPRKSGIECSLCDTNHLPRRIITLNCSHQFCVTCSVNNHAYAIVQNKETSCPLCRTPLSNKIKQQLETREAYRKCLIIAEQKHHEEQLQLLEEESANLSIEETTNLCVSCNDKNIKKIASRTLPCSHMFCTKCLVKYHAKKMQSAQPSNCPTCNHPIFKEPINNDALKIKLEKDSRYQRYLNERKKS